MVDTDEVVLSQQLVVDDAEVLKLSLDSYMSIFQNAHIHFRSIAKGAFGG